MDVYYIINDLENKMKELSKQSISFLPLLSDDVILKELTRRGYSVTKLNREQRRNKK